MSESFTSFVGGRICLDGELIESHLVISNSTGDIVSCSGDIRGDVLQLNGSIIAPGFLELQANGVRGFHFTHFENSERYATRPDEVARYLPSTGVTGFYPTIPKVASETFQKVQQRSKLKPLLFVWTSLADRESPVDTSLSEAPRAARRSQRTGSACGGSLPPSQQERRS